MIGRRVERRLRAGTVLDPASPVRRPAVAPHDRSEADLLIRRGSCGSLVSCLTSQQVCRAKVHSRKLTLTSAELSVAQLLAACCVGSEHEHNLRGSVRSPSNLFPEHHLLLPHLFLSKAIGGRQQVRNRKSSKEDHLHAASSRRTLHSESVSNTRKRRPIFPRPILPVGLRD